MLALGELRGVVEVDRAVLHRHVRLRAVGRTDGKRDHIGLRGVAVGRRRRHRLVSGRCVDVRGRQGVCEGPYKGTAKRRVATRPVSFFCAVTPFDVETRVGSLHVVLEFEHFGLVHLGDVGQLQYDHVDDAVHQQKLFEFCVGRYRVAHFYTDVMQATLVNER